VVTITGKQLKTIARFQREFTIKDMVFSHDEEENLNIHATFDTRKQTQKIFKLNKDGNLIGKIETIRPNGD